MTTRPPCRPVQTVEDLSWSEREDGTLEVTIITRKKPTTFLVSRIKSEIGGVAMHWQRVGEGDSYDVLLCGVESSCTCAGAEWSAGCRHMQAAWEMQQVGALEGLT